MQLIAGLALLAGVVSVLGNELEGIDNCPNKCEKVFDKMQYAITDQPDATTFEYRACIIGCNKCSPTLSDVTPSSRVDDTCFKFCKTYNYASRGIRKGVIEPDKACIMGCVINTCQEICIGGTTDQDITDANRHLWWGLGGQGCSKKQGMGYVQNPDYGNPDTGGTGADEGQKQCCTNAFNLCYYNGDQSSVNYANVVKVTNRSCQKYAKSTNKDKICAYYNDERNCGTQGNNPAV